MMDTRRVSADDTSFTDLHGLIPELLVLIFCLPVIPNETFFAPCRGEVVKLNGEAVRHKPILWCVYFEFIQNESVNISLI